MSGRPCVLGTTNDLRNQRSQADGEIARFMGALVGTNPHPAGTPEATYWADGFTNAGTFPCSCYNGKVPPA